LQQALGQRPEIGAQLGLEPLGQPFGQVVALGLEEVPGRHGVAGIEPVGFLR